MVGSELNCTPGKREEKKSPQFLFFVTLLSERLEQAIHSFVYLYCY